ncbi:hypothetical protein [Nocardioides okcheonensis]|nr:hypothetical protein [Nocardioides okcheonensis]UFN44683.1 hypothetical protein LN652_00195 [Nocardioides okcheonensis]
MLITTVVVGPGAVARMVTRNGLSRPGGDPVAGPRAVVTTTGGGILPDP